MVVKIPEIKNDSYASVAQLDRAAAFSSICRSGVEEAAGHRFKSCRMYEIHHSLGYSQVGKAGAFEALILSLVQIQVPQRKCNGGCESPKQRATAILRQTKQPGVSARSYKA